MAITIYDIARLSGVSKSTVSRVLSNHPYVSQESRLKVQKAMEELHYVPNSLAKQFRTKQTKCIGILIPDLDHPYFSELVSSISLECHKRGYKTVVHQTFSDKRIEKEVYAQLRNKELDGIILTSSLLSEEEIAECVENRAIVACNEDFRGKCFDAFCLNEEEVIREATTHLLQKGLTKLGFCSDHIDTPSQQARLRGFIQAHDQLGLPYNKSYIFNQISTVEDGMLLGERLFKNHTDIQGMIAGSDFVAAGLIKSAANHGLRIPQDFSVIGFDNHPISMVTTPQISTIGNRITDMTRDLVDRIMNQLNGNKQAPMKKIYDGELIIRESD
ncbi:LacI family DNA-binding transcriptional regulator [Brevibacillus ginsengisoli]|uniref:LacI family DNA-binding transcriptional regulator n=1 Tax=Brevibacillus ginsengisoli TaxID=363854 RepID=UPI003CF21302